MRRWLCGFHSDNRIIFIHEIVGVGGITPTTWDLHDSKDAWGGRVWMNDCMVWLLSLFVLLAAFGADNMVIELD